MTNDESSQFKSNQPPAANSSSRSDSNPLNPVTNQVANRVTERQDRLIKEFSQLSDWEARYKQLIERGKHLAPMPVELHDERFKVKGCQSQVWLHAALNDSGEMILQADSDALIVKGLAALLVETYSAAKPEEILQAPSTFLKELGFEGHLSPSRANGLYAMLKQILYDVTAFQALAKLRGR